AVTWTSSNAAVATINTAGLAAGVAAGGPVTITATSGAISGSATLTVSRASTTTALSATPNPSYLGEPVTFTATVTSSSGAIATGTVSFVQGRTTLGTGTLDVNGRADFTTSSLPLGTDTVTASYGGTVDFGPSA